MSPRRESLYDHHDFREHHRTRKCLKLAGGVTLRRTCAGDRSVWSSSCRSTCHRHCKGDGVTGVSTRVRTKGDCSDDVRAVAPADAGESDRTIIRRRSICGAIRLVHLPPVVGGEGTHVNRITWIGQGEMERAWGTSRRVPYVFVFCQSHAINVAVHGDLPLRLRYE